MAVLRKWWKLTPKTSLLAGHVELSILSNRFTRFFQSLQMIRNFIPNDPTKFLPELIYTILSFLSFENQTMVARTHAVNTRMEKKNNGEIDLEETWRTADRATSSSFKLESDVTRRGKGRITRCGRNAFP